MNQPLLILAAHGCREDYGVNKRLIDLATLVEQRSQYEHVTVAFHSGEPAFSNVLDRGGAGGRAGQPRASAWGSDCVVVVPLMTSAGYFSRVVLPRELARNDRYGEVRVTIAEPVGGHPEMVSLVAGRVRALLRTYALDRNETALAVVGHGTPRHPESDRATLDLAAKLRAMALSDEVVAAFLDQSPQVPTIIERTTSPFVVVIPFMIADGPHTKRDIPAQLGMTPGGTVLRSKAVADTYMQRLPRGTTRPSSRSVHGLPAADRATRPARGRVADRWIAYDRAIGEDPGLVPLIISLAEECL